MSRKSSSSLSCSRCGGEVKRAHRSSDELRAGTGTGLRRYRCLEEGCGWQGMLAVHAPKGVSSAGAQPIKLAWQMWAVGGALVLVLVLAVAVIARHAFQPDLLPSAPMQTLKPEKSDKP